MSLPSAFVTTPRTMPANAAAEHYEALCGHYQLHFVDRPRLSRSLEMLHKLRASLEGLTCAIDPELRRRAKATAAAWDEEARAIEKAQKEADDAARRRQALQEDWQRLRWRVARVQRLHPQAAAASVHLWVGPTEDAALLAEAGKAAGEHQLADEAAQLGQHLDAQRARALATRAQADATTLAQQGVLAARAALADLAHAVAGRSMAVVRPSFLQARVHELRDAHAAMVRAGEAGFGDAAHRANCDALAEQVQSWQLQLRQITAKRRQYTADELAHALGEEADAVLEAADAAAQSPAPEVATAYLALRMDELHRQLQGVPLLFGHGQHRETLAGLADCLAYLERPATR